MCSRAASSIRRDAVATMEEEEADAERPNKMAIGVKSELDGDVWPAVKKSLRRTPIRWWRDVVVEIADRVEVDSIPAEED